MRQAGRSGTGPVFNIQPDAGGLTEAEDGKPGPSALRQATNDFGNANYDGPQPPAGHGVHHYHFRLAALDVPSLGVPGQAGVHQVWKQAQKHALQETELVGTYERPA